ncbi:glycoside hydrolase family protein [Spirosoma radiotolerans]|uniref:Glycosylase n=1 Tax=Spirosoma radiotolerans TaxID=1379870 RepID=A0A0E3ZV65_9BACT|nr:glycosylase [Spirosoma radiotolerans]AKD55619.1 glycosylase [Spirosoma radiotolerans]
MLTLIRSAFVVSFLVAGLGFAQWTGLDTPHLAGQDVPAFPAELTTFTPNSTNPVFAGTGTDTWDQKIRERGYILREGNTYHLWYTGYRDGTDQNRSLGYATSADGVTWTRYKDNPIHASTWVEDMCVVKSGNTYYMVAEGRNDVAHLLTSPNRIHWTEQGPLDIRYTTHQPLSQGPYGTPTLWKEKDTWYLFYERKDQAVWLATSKDLKVWTNVQDEPVLEKGPAGYDRYAVAMNQIIHYKGAYYAYYHASAFADWHEWSTNIAVSTDLVHWTKYSANPITSGNKSSGIVVNDGKQYRLYTMHPAVNLFLPTKGDGK